MSPEKPKQSQSDYLRKFQPTAADVGVVVNYFTNYASEQTRQVLVASTTVSLRLLRLSSVVRTILLVDGSERPDEEMRAACELVGVDYYHHGHRISYVDAYNLGWRRLEEPVIALMANDIIPHPVDVIQKLRVILDDENVGCTFPYFASNRIGGDEVQRLGFGKRGRVTCEPASMTLNLNLFPRSVLEAIGGLDPNYLSGYSEPILMLRIRGHGKRVVMVGDARVIHYDRLTKDLGESTIDSTLHRKDTARWYSEYSKFASKRGLANIDLAKSPFATTRLMQILWTFAFRISTKKIRSRMISLLLYWEPLLTRYRPYPKTRSRARHTYHPIPIP